MIRFLDSRRESLLLSMLALFTLRIRTAHIFHMVLTTLTLLILCHALQRKSEKCTKSWCTCRAIANEPFVFGRVLIA